MRRWAFILMLLCSVPLSSQNRVNHVCVDKKATASERYAASQLREFLNQGKLNTDTLAGKKGTVFVGNTSYLRKHFASLLDSLRDNGYLIAGDGKNLCLYGVGEKGTLYAVYAFLESVGYRMYTPSATVIPDMFTLRVPTCNTVSNPAFEWREVSYYYPNHSRLYADWHHLHTVADRNGQWGLFVHTFQKLIPPSLYFDSHSEWFSLNNGRRSRDGQLCLSNPEVLEMLCRRLADTMAAFPNKKIWSVSPNDNYNACECDNCRRLDSVYGGPSGTLIWFVNQVARRFPDFTIATLAYQYTRKAPSVDIKPDSNVLVMLCPIEAGREQPIATSPREASFRKDMDDWSRLTGNLFIWDYVVQFRNFWNPFPNLHVLQPNLQYFRNNGARMMFEQASGANNITSWMDIRCYMIAKLLWNPDADMDSIMTDFYQGYYGDAGRYVKEIVDTMTSALIASGQRLDIYGFPVDGANGYLSVEHFHMYDSLMRQAYRNAPRHYIGCFEAPDSALWFFGMALEFARNELAVSCDLCGYLGLDSIPDDITPITERLEHFCVSTYSFKVPQMMEMGISPDQCAVTWSDNLHKRFGENKARHKTMTLRKPATAPYNTTTLVDGKCGIMDYRHDWVGFWGDTLDAVIDLGEPTEIHEVHLDFYFYPLSWIFRPQWIKVYLSDDGVQWRAEGVDRPLQPKVLATPSIYGFKYVFPQARKARYVRVEAMPLPEIPAWHRAAGQKPWIFTDEIIVR